MKLSNRLDVFSEYVFSMLGKKVKEQEKKTGKKVLDLSIGTPNFPPSKEYVQKLQEFYTEPKASLYPGFGAIPEFSEALISWYKKRFNVLISDNELLPLLGAKEAIAHLLPALINEEDEILIPDPGYPAYIGSALMAKAIPVFYSLDNNFKLSIDEIDKKITNKTKCIWVNFPSNPTGQVATTDELQKLIDFLKGKNIWLIYDNAYSEIAFDGFVAPSILEIDGAKEFTVELNSFSKMFSFAGYRIGWAAGNKDAISGLAK
ncbi:MAG: pyridoxal phosphate-dependent aminotransferase, partial [bacterium]|nr:pyridoxal phosphate-dependent aminotransferase [bacterium]